MALPSTDDVVLIDGSVDFVPVDAEPTRSRLPTRRRRGLIPAANPTLTSTFGVVPTRIQAWRNVAELRGRTIMRDGRWIDRLTVKPRAGQEQERCQSRPSIEPETGAEDAPAARRVVWGDDGHGGERPAPRSRRRHTDESPFGPGRRALTFGLLLTVVGVAFEALAVATVLPAVVADLGGLQPLRLGLLRASCSRSSSASSSPGCWPMLAARPCPSRWACCSSRRALVVGGLAPSMPVLIAGRALQGFGGGAIASIAYVAIGRGYPEGAKPRMLALLSTAWVVPGLVGPGLAGLMAEGLGWRSIFLVLAPLPIVTGALALPSLRRMAAGTPSPEGRARGRVSAVRARRRARGSC